MSDPQNDIEEDDDYDEEEDDSANAKGQKLFTLEKDIEKYKLNNVVEILAFKKKEEMKLIESLSEEIRHNI